MHTHAPQDLSLVQASQVKLWKIPGICLPSKTKHLGKSASQPHSLDELCAGHVCAETLVVSDRLSSHFFLEPPLDVKPLRVLRKLIAYKHTKHPGGMNPQAGSPPTIVTCSEHAWMKRLSERHIMSKERSSK